MEPNASPNAAHSQPPVARPAPRREALDNPWIILGLLFGVTLFLGLPLLWISRGFSTLGKVVVTIAVLLWSALLLWVFWLIMLWCYMRLRDAFAPPGAGLQAARVPHMAAPPL
jgi:hypothetical protein